MNIAKCAQATSIMNNVKSGHYIKGAKFANFGSVVTDTLFGQQREAQLKLQQIKMRKALKGA